MTSDSREPDSERTIVFGRDLMNDNIGIIALRGLLALAVGLLPGCHKNPKVERSTQFNDDTARTRMVSYYKQEKRESIDPSFMKFRPVGDDFRVVLVPGECQPACHEAWVVGRVPHSIKRLDVNSLTTAFVSSYPPCNTEAERLQAAGLFVELLSYEGSLTTGPAKIVESIDQIPGYEKSPLDPDVASALRSPYNPAENQLVLFTYQPAGGIFSRYKFFFREDGRLSGAYQSKLDEGVGAAHYYQ